MLHIQLLGGMQVTDASGSPIAITAKKSRALLAYLALQPDHKASRDALAQLLWSGMDSEFGKTNLRQSLSALRKQLDHQAQPVLLSVGNMLALDSRHIRVDVVEFEQGITATAENLQVHCIDLYRGELLQDFGPVDDAFDEWLLVERARLQQLLIATLESQITHPVRNQSASSQITSTNLTQIANRLLREDTTNEIAHRALMKCYAESGDRQRAVKQYQNCRESLSSQLDIEPSADTEALYASIRQRGQTCPDPEVTATGYTGAASVGNLSHNAELPVTTDAVLRMSKAKLVIAGVVLTVALMWIVRVIQPAYVDSSAPVSITGNSDLVLPTPVTATQAVAYHEPLQVDPTVQQRRQSIAVLPFKNLSEDPAQIYFSDGLSDDLATEISRISGLRVIASQSSFLFRDNPDDLQAIEDFLHVDYLLTGSVRRSDSKVRVNARLVRMTDNEYVWSEKYDRNMDDILSVQDEITRQIVGALSVELTESEWQRLSHTRSVSPKAYDLLLRGLHPFSQFTSEGINEARQYFEAAIAIDPSYARPYANIALSYGREVVFQLQARQADNIRIGLEYADKAYALDPSLPQTQFARAVLKLANREHGDALYAALQSIALDANYADGLAVLAQVSAYTGELDVALESIASAKALNPVVPFTYHWVEGHILYQLGRYDEAKTALNMVFERNPSFYVGLLTLAATYGQLGDLDEAEWLMHEILTVRPTFSATQESADAPFLHADLQQHFLDGMRKAGLPD